MIKPGALVIDAGIDFDENGKICGDCDKAMYADDFNAGVTPVPGGVGLMTRYELMENIAWRFFNMKTIWKYPINPSDDKIELSIPGGGPVLSAGLDPIGQVCVWAAVDTEKEGRTS